MTTFFLVCFILLSYLLFGSHKHITPASIWTAGWLVLIILHAILPLGLTPLSDGAAVITGVGVTAFLIGYYFVKQPEVCSAPSTRQAPDISHSRYAIGSGILCLLLLYGLLSFQAGISAKAGMAYSSLDQVAIRRLQARGSDRSTGFGSIFIAIAPLVACWSIYGGLRIKKYWFSLLPFVFFVTLRSPSRTLTISVIMAGIVFYLYLRPREQQFTNKLRLAFLLSSVGGTVLIYFQFVGNALHKTNLTSKGLTPSWIPNYLITPFIYELGGLSALSTTQIFGIDPVMGEQGRSVYIFYRFLAVFSNIKTPDTVADFVPIPLPFNVYTGFGDVWFDFGSLGVGIVFAAVGFIVAVVHRKARTGDIKFVWLAATILSVISGTPLTLRLFNVDVVVMAIIGIIAFQVVIVKNVKSRKSVAWHRTGIALESRQHAG